MLLHKGPQSCGVPCIQKFHGAAKRVVFNALMMRQIQFVGEGGFFNMPLQPRPAREPSLARDGGLCVAELELGVEDFRIRRLSESRMKFSQLLRKGWKAGSMILEQIFRLIFQMVEVGIRWEASYRHGGLPFVSPRSACDGQKVSSWNRIVTSRWTSVLSADRMRLSRSKILPQRCF